MRKGLWVARQSCESVRAVQRALLCTHFVLCFSSPYSLRSRMLRNWMTASCLEMLGCSMGMSATARSLPKR